MRSIACASRWQRCVGDRGDTGMGVHAHLAGCRFQMKPVQEDEGLDHLPDIARADQADDAAVGVALTEVGDIALGFNLIHVRSNV